MTLDKQIMSLFYRSIVESVMSYCIISWFGSSHKKDQHKLAKIGKIAKRMGVNSKNLNELYQNDCINMVDKILKDAHHPLLCIPEKWEETKCTCAAYKSSQKYFCPVQH